MNFQDLQLKDFIRTGLKSINFTKMTDIQSKVIVPALKNKNIIACSNPGTGKTHAFLIPILQNIDCSLEQVQAVIISPTRELANQIYEMAKVFIDLNPQIKISIISGGQDLKQMSAKLKNQPHIVIATVNRLHDLYQQQILKITQATAIVIDECDMIFELGFLETLDFLLRKININKQIMVFSATINQELEIFLKKYLQKPELINIANYQTQKINHILIHTKNQDRKKKLLELLTTFNPYLCFIFVNKKEDVSSIFSSLQTEGYSVCQLHGGLESRERKNILKEIQNSQYQYIIATDVMARGIDIPAVSHVISLQLPNNIEYYIHRSGRTARNNNSGISYVLYDDSELKKITKLKKFNINFSNLTQKKFHFQSEQTSEIQKIKAKHSKIVKPGYKKKIKTEIERLRKKTLKRRYKGGKNE